MIRRMGQTLVQFKDLRVIRERAGLSTFDVAAAIGVHATTVQKRELLNTKIHPLLHLEHQRALMRLVKMTPEELTAYRLSRGRKRP